MIHNTAMCAASEIKTQSWYFSATGCSCLLHLSWNNEDINFRASSFCAIRKQQRFYKPWTFDSNSYIFFCLKNDLNIIGILTLTFITLAWDVVYLLPKVRKKPDDLMQFIGFESWITKMTTPWIFPVILYPPDQQFWHIGRYRYLKLPPL